MKLSIVATLYNSAPYLEEFCRRSKDSASKLVGDDYEIVLVNDGSPDNSLEVALRLFEEDAHIVIVDLSRNFGHHKAMMTGLDHSSGELVFLTDCDLEESPEWVIEFSKIIQKEKCDVVYGSQKCRKGGWVEKLTGNVFYCLFQFLTKLDLPKNVTTSRLMSRRYVNALLLHKERELFVLGIWHITGFVQLSTNVTKAHSSPTTYTIKRRISVFVNSITSFTNAPLVFIFYVGATLSFLSIVYITYLIVNWSVFSTPQSGWTSVMASVWLLGSLIISFIGIIGIYLSKVFSETKHRPYTIVREIYERK